jgi:hypothetical protein
LPAVGEGDRLAEMKTMARSGRIEPNDRRHRQ